MAKVSPFWTGTSYQHPLSTQPHPHGKTVLNTPDDVEHEEIFITNDQGLRLCIQRWRRKDHESRPVVGCIVCLHGLNTHAGYVSSDPFVRVCLLACTFLLDVCMYGFMYVFLLRFHSFSWH